MPDGVLAAENATEMGAVEDDFTAVLLSIIN